MFIIFALMNYKLTLPAIDFLKETIKESEGAADLMRILKLKEAQIRNIIKDNSANGQLTMVAVVEYIKGNSPLSSESQILETV